LSWIKKIARHMPEPTSAKQLRSFGLIVGGVFFLMGVFPLVRGHELRLWAVVVGGLFILPALVVPKTLRYPFRIWMLIGHCLGWVNTRIIMTILFYVMFTPVALLMRLMKRDAMTRGFDKRVETYRTRKDVRPASHLKHQF
jgi:hypothetical protein